MKLKKLTVANLKKDDACDEGMEWITPLIKAKDAELNRKLFQHNSSWWGWAAGRGYDVWDGVEDLLPQHEHIKALVIQIAQLTDDDAHRLRAARNSAWDAWNARSAARNAARNAARIDAWDAVWNAARNAAWDAAWDAARGAAWNARGAARGAALVLLMRDKIGEHGFTQDHYDVLTKPWRTVIGPVHPDDAEVLHG